VLLNNRGVGVAPPFQVVVVCTLIELGVVLFVIGRGGWRKRR
jgi:hypothetical protein